MSEKDMEKVLEALERLYGLPNFRDIFISATRTLSPDDVEKLNELINHRIEVLSIIREAVRTLRN
jgi:hypothetical protein